MHILRHCFYLWVLAFSLLSAASVVAPDDGPYYRLRKGQTLYIYDETSRGLIDQLTAYNQAVRAMYDQSFGWKLDEEMDLLLTSPKQQVANAYATVSPNIKTVWYPSGAAMVEEMADSSWMLLLNAHEVAHLYQLNAKGEFNSGLKSIFGNAFLLWPVIPIFVHPNFLTPTFIIEGNATFNESRLNLGGRLHSGEKRALVLAQIAAGDIDPTRLINDDFRFPFGEESYMQGAYFQAHLATKYGVEKTNHFFVEQGKHFFWPLILNKTFRDHFGNSYPQEIHEYVRNMESLAKNQQRSSGETLIDTTFVGSLNHDDKRIFFLTTRGKELPLLQVFNKATKSLDSRHIDLFTGKVFFDGATPLTSSSDQHDLHHTEYSLYGEGGRLDPRYRGQIVTDQRAGKTVSVDAADSWLQPKLLLNGEPYDIAQSHAILDNQGHVYYFRQNGTERILYKDREPVTKFEGFYAKPMEVTDDGTFYFIGSTDFGSTLYRLRGKEIVRVLKSDRVIDARWVAGDEFLVVEVNNLGHNIMITKAEPRAQLPATFSYGFPNVNLIPQKAISAEAVRQEERPYNSLGQMRYSALEFTTSYSTGPGVNGSALATFTDPLEYQAFTLGWAGSQFDDRSAVVQYSFTKYLPNFFARYTYEEDEWQTVNKVDQLAYDHEVIAGFNLPILRWRRWDSAIGLAGIYQHNDAHNDPSAPRRADVEESYGLLSSFSLNYTLPTALGFYPWRAFELSYVNRLETSANTWRKQDNTSLVQSSYVYGLPEEFYVTVAGAYAWAETPDIKVGADHATVSQDIRVSRLTSHKEEFLARNAGSARLEVTKVVTIPAYSARLPIGLNRIAPVVVGQGLFLDDDPANLYPQNTFEWGWGADLEVLLAHRIPVHVRFLQAYDTRSPIDADNKADLVYKMSF